MITAVGALGKVLRIGAVCKIQRDLLCSLSGIRRKEFSVGSGRSSVFGHNRFPITQFNARLSKSTSINSADIEETVLNVVKGFVKEGVELPKNADIAKDAGLDSLDQVEIVMALEDKFNVEFSDDDASSISTIGDAVKLIQKHLEKKA